MPATALLAKTVAMAAGLEVRVAMTLVEGEPEAPPVLLGPVWVRVITVELEVV